MNNKKNILNKITIIILMVFHTQLVADKLPFGRHYIHKQGYLELRDFPGDSGRTIAKIPYGARVDVEKEVSPREHEENGMKGFFRFASYKKLTGYIFDGYLSKYPTPINNRCDNLKNYADDSFKRLSSSLKNGKDIKGIITNYIGGIKHVLGKTNTERFQQLTLNNASFKDAYFIAKICSHPAFHGIKFPTEKEEISEVMDDLKGNKIQLIIKKYKEIITITQKEFYNISNKE